MQNKQRVPEIPNKSRFAMERWFYKLYANGILFHPDDRPEDVVTLASGMPLFTANECVTLNHALEVLFQHHGDAVYEVSLKYFHKAMNMAHDSSKA